MRIVGPVGANDTNRNVMWHSLLPEQVQDHLSSNTPSPTGIGRLENPTNPTQSLFLRGGSLTRTITAAEIKQVNRPTRYVVYTLTRSIKAAVMGTWSTTSRIIISRLSLSVGITEVRSGELRYNISTRFIYITLQAIVPIHWETMFAIVSYITTTSFSSCYIWFVVVTSRVNFRLVW